MQGRIDQPDHHGQPLHGPQHAAEVLLLDRQQRVQGLLALRLVLGQDHPLHHRQALRLEEHVLGAAEADPLGAELAGLLSVARVVAVGPHLQPPDLVGPAEEGLQIGLRGELRVASGDLAGEHLAGGAVDGDRIALLDHLIPGAHLAELVVDPQLAGTGHAGLAHRAGHHRGVAGGAAAGGEHAAGGDHPMDVVGRGLGPHQHHRLAGGTPLRRLVGGEHGLAGGGTGGGVQPRAQQPTVADRLLLVLGDEARQQQLHDVRGRHVLLADRRPLVDHALAHQVDRDLHRGRAGPLGRASLEHVQLAPLDRELQVLHVLVVLLQAGGDRLELAVDLGHVALEGGDRGRGADAGHHVLALGVQQVLAVELALAGGGIAGKGHPGAGVGAHIAEDHRLHVDGGAQIVGDAVEVAVIDRPLAVPGGEHRLDSQLQLLVGIGGERGPGLLLHDRLEADHQLLQRLDGQVGIGLGTGARLGVLQRVLETVPFHPQHDLCRTAA